MPPRHISAWTCSGLSRTSPRSPDRWDATAKGRSKSPRTYVRRLRAPWRRCDRAVPRWSTSSRSIDEMRGIPPASLRRRLDQLEAVAERIVDEDARIARQRLVLGHLAALRVRPFDETRKIAH